MKIIFEKIKSKKIAALFLGTVLFFCLASATVLAAGFVPCGGTGQSPCRLCDIFVLFDNIVKFILGKIVPPIAFLMVIIIGVMYLLAAGDPGKVETAKALIKSVLIGLFVIYGAYMIVNTFLTVIGVNIWTGPQQGWFKYPCH